MAERIPNSERLQRKMLANKYPDSNSKESQWFLIWFPEELRYSSVEGKNIVEEKPVVKTNVTVKEGKDHRWTGRLVYVGSKSACLKQQVTLEKILQGTISEIEKPSSDSESFIEEELSSKKGNRKKPSQLVSDSDDSDIDDHENVTKKRKQDDSCEALLEHETQRVHNLLQNAAASAKTPLEPKVKKTSGDLSVTMSRHANKTQNAYFEEVNKKLDEIKELVQCLVETKRTPSSAGMSSIMTPPAKNRKSSLHQYSPGGLLDNQSRNGSNSSPDTADTDQVLDEYMYNGVNLLSIPAKNKKPTLYATAVLSHLFTKKEMREGSVEPREGTKKHKLDQEKIDLLKKCLTYKYGDKVLEKCWADIRTSLNQKCLDQLKAYKKSMESTNPPLAENGEN